MNWTRITLLTTLGFCLLALAGCQVGSGAIGTDRRSASATTATDRYADVDPNSCWRTPVGTERAAPTKQQKIARIHMDLAVGYMQENVPEVAAEELRVALALEPNNAKIHHTMALLHLRLGDNELAAKAFLKALRLDPADPEIHNNYGVFLSGRDQLDLAIKHFECAIDNPLYSTPFMAYTNAGLTAIKKPDPATAERYFRTSLQLYERQPVAHIQLAKIYLEQYKINLANKHYKRYKGMAKQTIGSLEVGMAIARATGDENGFASLELQHRNMNPDGERGLKQ